MGNTAEVKPWYVKSLPGMNTKLENLEIQDKWVEIAQNCQFESEPGAVVKRQPLAYFNTTRIDGNPIMSAWRYYTSAGIAKFIVVSGTSVYVGDDSAGTFTAIRTSMTDSKRMSFVVYKDLLIGGNGFDDLFVYDGSSDNVTWELGSCKAKIGSGAGITRTVLSYAVTFDNDAVVLGAVSNEIASVTNQDIDLTNIPLGPIGTVNRKIYRKSSETGGSYRLIATIADNTTTIYNDTTADASVGVVMPAVTDDMPLGNILKIHRERLFIAGDPNAPNKIYFSNQYLPHYIQQTTNIDFVEISPNDNDEIMGLPIFLGTMICIKKNNIRKLQFSGPQATWYVEDPLNYSGSPAQWSIVETTYGVMYLGWDHWYIFDGARTTPIIDEFDTEDVLSSSYSDIVAFWYKDHLLAAYTDATAAAQFHDRVMRYNFKRKSLSYATIHANCFAAKLGDDETGELYYGASDDGFLYKAEIEDFQYRLQTKTQANAGTQATVYVGGTESSPYIEIGTEQSASAIPDNIIIFWEDEANTPGSGWTEITGFDNRLIMLSTTAGNTGGGAGHTHTASFTTDPDDSFGETQSTQASGSPRGHTHDFTSSTDSASGFPRNVKYRMFYKNSSTTEYEFPLGAIVMFDQTATPAGWTAINSDGYYIRTGTTGLGATNASEHTHTISVNVDPLVGPNGGDGTVNNQMADKDHVHSVSGTSDTANMEDWELDYVAFRFMKRTGETSTWDGNVHYVYALFRTAAALTNDWSESTTYDGLFLKIGVGIPSTGTAANPSHEHQFLGGTTGQANLSRGINQGVTNAGPGHTHTYQPFYTDSTDADTPAYVTFRLVRKILGKMKNYNNASEVQYTAGTWTAPSQQISASSLLQMSWNESIIGSDDIEFYFRTGATQAAAEAAAWIGPFTDPNSADFTGVTANAWLQYKIEFTAADTRVSNPRVYFSNSYVVRYTYSRLVNYAETSVPFLYKIGWRHFDSPAEDKIYKKIVVIHDGTEGDVILDWETEYASGSFTIPLADYPERWESYFQDDAFGRLVNISVSKTDNYDYTLKEIYGMYSPAPVVL